MNKLQLFLEHSYHFKELACIKCGVLFPSTDGPSVETSSKGDFVPIPAAAELALWHCAAFGSFSENVGVQPLPQTSLSLCELANMQTHTTDEAVAHTLDLKEESLPRFTCDSFLIASSLLPSFFFLRRNRFPCCDLIPG